MTGTWTLGIDFGTSFTVVAVHADGRPESIDIDGQRRTPSVVLVDDDGSVRVGSAAEALSATRPGRTLREPKRRIGEPAPVVLGGSAHSVVDLVGALLTFVYGEAVRHQGSEPAEVRLTHPASWGRPRLAELRRAAAIAGIHDVTLVPEPVAAAVAYADEAELDADRNVAVYDLGGGTFDTAVLRCAEGGFVIQGRPGGDPHLGGELFDELLTQHVASQLPDDVRNALAVSDEVIWRQAAAGLRAAARTAKEQLSSQDYAELIVALPTGMVPVRVERADLEALIEPHIAETVELLVRTIADAGLTPADLDAVYLTGGASRTPLVESRLRDALPGVTVLRRADPKLAVALGATLPAAIRALDVTSPIAIVDEPTHVRRTVVNTEESEFAPPGAAVGAGVTAAATAGVEEPSVAAGPSVAAEPSVVDEPAGEAVSESGDAPGTEGSPDVAAPPPAADGTRLDGDSELAGAAAAAGIAGATVVGSSLAEPGAGDDGDAPPPPSPLEPAGGDGGEARSRRTLWLVGAAAALVVLLGGIGIAVAASGSDDSPQPTAEAAVKRRPRSSTTTSTTTTTTAPVPGEPIVVPPPPGTPSTTRAQTVTTTTTRTIVTTTTTPTTHPAPPAPSVTITGPSSCAVGGTCGWQAVVSNGTSGSWSSSCGGGGSWPANSYYSISRSTPGTCSISLTISGPGGTRTGSRTVTFS
jgi:actin-like ATPase involved in cell morphogenesis